MSANGEGQKRIIIYDKADCPFVCLLFFRVSILDRQIDRKIDRQKDRHKQIDKQKDRHRQIDRQFGRQMDLYIIYLIIHCFLFLCQQIVLILRSILQVFGKKRINILINTRQIIINLKIRCSLYLFIKNLLFFQPLKAREYPPPTHTPLTTPLAEKFNVLFFVT